MENQEKTKTKDKVIAGALVLLIIGLSGALLYENHRYQVLLNEKIASGNAPQWGATVTMSVFRDNVLISEEIRHNLIPNAALSALRGHIADSTLSVWKYIAIGTSTGGDATSTVLENEYARYAATYATVGSYNFTLTLTFTAGNFSGQTIVEYGVFNDPTADTGVMLSYNDDFSRGPLLADDTLQVVANFQIADGG